MQPSAGTSARRDPTGAAGRDADDRDLATEGGGGRASGRHAGCRTSGGRGTGRQPCPRAGATATARVSRLPQDITAKRAVLGDEGMTQRSCRSESRCASDAQATNHRERLDRPDERVPLEEFRSFRSSRSSFGAVVGADSAPKHELLGRGDRRDRVELEKPEALHRLEHVGCGAVERLGANGEPASFLDADLCAPVSHRGIRTVALRAATLPRVIGRDVISTNQFKTGMHIEHRGAMWRMIDFQHVKPGKGGAFVRTKLKNLETGAVIDRHLPRRREVHARAHRDEERPVPLRRRERGALHGRAACSSVGLPRAEVAEELAYILPSSTVQNLVVNGKPSGLQMPSSVEPWSPSRARRQG